MYTQAMLSICQGEPVGGNERFTLIPLLNNIFTFEVDV